MSNIKQVIVIRKDLNMRKGKMVAQGAHASISVLADALRVAATDWDHDRLVSLEPEMIQWLEQGQTKICVSVNSEEELLAVFEAAKEAKLPRSLIRDAGHTEFNEPTLTAVAIGPAIASKIDKITGKLTLL